MKLILTVIVLNIFLALNVSAQVCGPTYKDIDVRCLKAQTKKFAQAVSREDKREKFLEQEKNNPKSKNLKRAELQRNLVFVFGDDESLKSKINSIYFYETSAGNFGKFIIRSITKTKSSCSMYIDSTTFNPKGNIDKNTTFSISNESNSWNVDRGSLDDALGSDFILRREYGICVFKKINSNIIFGTKFEEVEEEVGNIILMYAALFLIGLAVFLISQTVFQDEDRFKAQEKLEDAEQDTTQKTPNDIILKYSRPFFKRYFTPIIMGMKNRRKIKEKYKRPLATSGMGKFLTPEDFYAFKLFLIIGFPIVFLGLRSFLEETWPLSYVPIVSILGFYYPDIWIKGKMDQRRVNIMENMPFVVDMLALSVEAGLDFVAAMAKVIEKAPPSSLVEEFEMLIKETKIGSSRSEALRQLSWRVDTLSVSSFCATLIAADSVGANISPILKTLAKELREKRSSLIEQKGAQAATKILIPMIFFVLPAVLLVIIAPIALQLVGKQ